MKRIVQQYLVGLKGFCRVTISQPPRPFEGNPHARAQQHRQQQQQPHMQTSVAPANTHGKTHRWVTWTPRARAPSTSLLWGRTCSPGSLRVSRSTGKGHRETWWYGARRRGRRNSGGAVADCFVSLFSLCLCLSLSVFRVLWMLSVSRVFGYVVVGVLSACACMYLFFVSTPYEGGEGGFMQEAGHREIQPPASGSETVRCR